MNTWQKIYSALKKAGIAVYPSGRHIGICTSPYCVVQQAGTYSAGNSFDGNNYTGYYIHAYVPIREYTELAVLIDSVRKALETLEKERIIYSTGFESVHQIDDSFAAHTAYIEYRAFQSTASKS